MARKKTAGRKTDKARPKAGRPRPAAPKQSALTRQELLQWLAGLPVDDIRAVLMAAGRDPEVEELDLRGEPGQLVEQLDGNRPRLEHLIAAIEDALGIDEEELGRRARGEFVGPDEVQPDELEVELDEDGFGFEPDDDEFRL
ncbi:MAG: hypothetical protein R6X14_06655 [bacterium]